MHRLLLFNLLRNYNPIDHDELVFKDQILKFIENNINCFERSLKIGHVTASAFLLNKDRTKALLMHHKKLNIWVQLGGHCDGNHNVLEVALKEAQEESGLKNIIPVSKSIFDIDIHLIPDNKKEKEHYHYDIRFLLQENNNDKITQNSESKELRWFDKNLSNLPTNNRSVIRLFEKWANI